MEKEEIHFIFENQGYYQLGKHLSYKLWVKGFGEICDEETMEDFLQAFEFEEGAPIFTDSFLYYFHLYEAVIKNEGLKEILRYL